MRTQKIDHAVIPKVLLLSFLGSCLCDVRNLFFYLIIPIKCVKVLGSSRLKIKFLFFHKNTKFLIKIITL